jgi:FAD/FMN-containing dehydrogenase
VLQVLAADKAKSTIRVGAGMRYTEFLKEAQKAGMSVQVRLTLQQLSFGFFAIRMKLLFDDAIGPSTLALSHLACRLGLAHGHIAACRSKAASTLLCGRGFLKEA